MKPTLYRGKNEKREWVYGYYVELIDYLTKEPVHVIVEKDATLYPRCEICGLEIVDPETVSKRIECPCYDVNRRNGQIFRGDIVEVYSRHNFGFNALYIAIAVNDHYMIKSDGCGVYTQDTVEVKVIGNVWDNLWDTRMIISDYALERFKMWMQQ